MAESLQAIRRSRVNKNGRLIFSNALVTNERMKDNLVATKGHPRNLTQCEKVLEV